MNLESVSFYRLVMKDVSTGTKKTITASKPIRGRYPAEEVLEKVRRANRDPRMIYELERAPEQCEEANDGGILEHHFRDRN